jgi:hypothetical protein
VSTILYLKGIDTFWLSAVPPSQEQHYFAKEILRYFRTGEDQLFVVDPTYFTSRVEAIAAAEAMGFTVIQ